MKPVPGFPDYCVTEGGRILRDGRELGGWINNKGYRCVTLSVGGQEVKRTVHSLVAETYLGPAPPGHEVDHKNDQRADNRVLNLQYLTHPENMAKRQGVVEAQRAGRGTKLTQGDVDEIRRRCADGELQRLVAADFGISQTQVSRIVSGKRWPI